MDVYEFTEALRRQRRFLIIGAILLMVGTFLLTFKPSADGIEPRIGPRYETSVRMIVSDGSVASLATAPAGGDAMTATAAFFQTLLLGPDASRAIASRTGVALHEFQVSTEGAVMTVRTVADSPEGAVSAALASYDWLTERLEQPLDLVNVTPTTEPPSLLSADGYLTSRITITASPAFAADGEGLWISLGVDDTQFHTVSLIDASLENTTTAPVPISPGGELTIGLEDATRNRLDELKVPIAELAAPDTVHQTLRLRLDRGAVIGIKDAATSDDGPTVRDVSNASLLAERISTSWEVDEAAQPVEPPGHSIALSLLTDTPIPLLTGARRGPILALGALFGGLFALFATAIAVDNWRQAHRSRAATAYDERLAVVRLPSSGDHYGGSGPLSYRLRRAEETDRRPAAGDDG